MQGDHVKGETVIRLDTARLKREGHWLYFERAWYPVSNTLTNQEGGRGRDSVNNLSLGREYESRLLAGICMVRTENNSTVRLKNRLQRQWQVTRVNSLKADVNRVQRSVIGRLNEWSDDHWSATLESLDPEDQSLWRMTKRGTRVPTPSPPLVTQGGTAL